ncbi:MAG: lysophospholipid acyltransferase family protein [Gemmatimonadota bacterium]|nr:lysophospholipid acyltransferase family protein [Gemmatimonadota bacterium]
MKLLARTVPGRRKNPSGLSKRLRHLFEYGLFRVLIFVLGIMPHRLALAAGKALGSIVWRVVGYRKSVMCKNMGLAFPQEKPAEIERTALACYRNLGRIFFEYSRIMRLSDSWMARNIHVHGQDLLDKAVESGRGAIIVSFHYGNWELMGACIGRLGYPLDVTSRVQTNQPFNDYITRIRQANGITLLPLTGSAHKRILNSLKQGRFVGFLADQDAGRGGVFVDFLGRPASTPKGPALYSFLTGVPVVMGFMPPRDGGGWEIVFEEVPRPDTKNREDFIREMTAYYTARLEEYVRQSPENWFWLHRRWKTQP